MTVTCSIGFSNSGFRGTSAGDETLVSDLIFELTNRPFESRRGIKFILAYAGLTSRASPVILGSDG